MRKISGRIEVRSVLEHADSISQEIMPKTTHVTGKMQREKNRRLFEDMDRIEKRGKFVAMKW